MLYDIEIGRYTYGHECLEIRNWGETRKLKIGSFCSIAEKVRIFLGGNHDLHIPTTYPFGHLHQRVFTNAPPTAAYGGDVVIGNDVWIGTSATIMPGVTVGDGAVIAANAHVVKNVDPYTIVGGNPAKHIRNRFPFDIVEALLKYKWWDCTDQQINTRLMPYLTAPDRFDELFAELEAIHNERT